MVIGYFILLASCIVFMAGGLMAWLIRDIKLRRCWQRGSVPAALLMRVHPQQVPEGTTLDEYTVVARTPASLAELDGEACPVCRSEYLRAGSGLALACRHSLCTTCLCRVLRTQRLAAQCPLCRHALVERRRAAQAAEEGKSARVDVQDARAAAALQAVALAA